MALAQSSLNNSACLNNKNCRSWAALEAFCNAISANKGYYYYMVEELKFLERG